MRTAKAGIAMAIIGSMLAAPLSAAGRQDVEPGVLGGTAKHEAKKPCTDYTVRARVVSDGTIAETVPLDAQCGFTLSGLGLTNQLVELINKDGKVVCTEGPYLLTQAAPHKTDVDIKCGIPPAAYLLLAPLGALGFLGGDAESGSQ